jgi:DNA-binding transcriptional LysR family regulator
MEMIMNFDIDCLRSFVVAADTLSVSRAADSVARSQSTVSQQIAKLEAQVGKPLLVRRKGRVIELTSEGGKLLEFARQILQLNDKAYASMSDDVLTGFIRLGVPFDFFGRGFGNWIALFKNRHPMVGLEIESNQSGNLRRRSEQGEFDLAFFRQEAGGNGIVALSEQLVWVSGPSYCPDALNSLPLILFPDGCAYRRHAVAALKDHDRAWHLSLVSPSLESLKSAVAEGMGMTVLARGLVMPPLRIVRRADLPMLPSVDLAYAFGPRGNFRAVSALANYLTDSLVSASTTA